jgi:hypothetical protein
LGFHSKALELVMPKHRRKYFLTFLWATFKTLFLLLRIFSIQVGLKRAIFEIIKCSSGQ